MLDGRVHLPDDAGLRGLTEREIRAGWTLLCQARASSDVRIAAQSDGSGPAVRTLPARVASRKRLADDVMELRLQLPPTERLQYRAGQYVDILLRDGRRRAFSLANCPADDEHLVLHIRHVPGGAFSGQVFEALGERALLRLQGPLGNFHLRTDSDRPAVFLAGGTGFAPIKAIVENALLAPLRREMHLYWESAPNGTCTCPTCRGSGRMRTPGCTSYQCFPSPIRGGTDAPAWSTKRSSPTFRTSPDTRCTRADHLPW